MTVRSKNLFKAGSGGSSSRLFFFQGKAPTLLCIIVLAVAVAIGIAGLFILFGDSHQQGYYYLKTSATVQKRKSNDAIGSVSSSDMTDIQHGGKEPLLNNVAGVLADFETTGTPVNTTEDSDIIMSMEVVEQSSRAYPIWTDIDKRVRAVGSNSRPYGWCVSEDLATNNVESPMGLLFVKVHKCSSSTGAGVTLRIQDGLSKRLNQPNQNQTADPHNTHGTCFAHYAHATARALNFQKRDPSQSFLWSIVREPAQRTLR